MCFYVNFDSQHKVTSLKNLILFLKHFNMYERDNLKGGILWVGYVA